MRVMVTGASGFIGRAVVAELVRRDHIVVRLSRADVDLLDHKRVLAAVGDVRPEGAVLLGWDTRPGAYLHDESGNLASLAASRNLLNALRASACHSVALAGTCLENLEPSDEVSSTPYGQAKRALHQHAVGLARSDFQIACGHIFWLYGPHEHPARAVATVVTHLLRGEPIGVTAGTQRRDLLYVDDVAAGLCYMLENVQGFEQIDVCSGIHITMREVFEQIGTIIGRPDLIRFGARPTTGSDDFVVVGDPGPLRSKGWRPTWTLEEGLRETVNWWRRELAERTEVQL